MTDSDRLKLLLKRVEFLIEKSELIHASCHRLETKGDAIMADLTRLTQEVSETATVIDSAVVLIGGLAEQIRALSTDPAALNALADQLDSKANELGAAVQENTPAPPPEEPPAEPPV